MISTKLCLWMGITAGYQFSVFRMEKGTRNQTLAKESHCHITE